MAEPISLAETKAQLRVDGSDDDALIGSLILAARQHVEDYTGLVLVPRTITETAPMLGRCIDLASWPVTAVTAIRYPAAGVMTAMDLAGIAVSYKRRPVRILPATWGWGLGMPAYAAVPQLPVEIDVAAGFAAADVPATARQAMLLLISHWYGNRDAAEVGQRAAAIELPFGVEVLLRRWRLVTI